MKKTFYIIALWLLWLVWFTSADITSLNVTPTTQSAISGSSVTFTITWTNTTGDMYLKYVLPFTASYSLMYQSSNITPINNLYINPLSPDPIFAIAANSNFSVTITAKLVATNRSFLPISTMATFGTDQRVSTSLTSAVAQITPIADLTITNILSWNNPSFSGDVVLYYITLQNIWSTAANGISFMSNIPIPMFSAPFSSTFNRAPHTYNYIDFLLHEYVWTGNYLNPLNAWASMTVTVKTLMAQNLSVGTTFNQIARVATTNPEYTTGNNSATATGIVQAPANVWITKTQAPFTGYHAGDIIKYTLTYGNNWGKPANNVVITDLVPAGITIPVNTFTIGTLPAGSGGTMVLTGTLNATSTSWTTFVNTANITTTSFDSTTGDNSSTVTGTVQGIAGISVNVTANNLSKPQLDNAPYGSGPSTMIQAVSGDLVQFTITYANNGNTMWTHAILWLSWIWGFTSLSSFNGTINLIPIDYTGTIVLTGIVGPRNYISFSPTARLTHDMGEIVTDSIVIQEPLVCGDGILTRTEPCDTAGQLGVLYSGQVCQNQLGACVLITQSIVNNACISYQYNNPLGGIITGQSCSSVNAALMNATCSTMTGSTPVVTNNGYTINFACTASNATPTTPISIDCGNGTSVSWMGTNFNGTCSYASWFVGSNAQCRVGNDITNVACRVPVAWNQMQCDLEALDGRIVIVDDNGNGEGRFRCETRNAAIAQTMRIDCGNGGISDQHQQYADATNTSQIETVCSYDENINSLPLGKNVQCFVNSAVCENENIIVDQPAFWRCGDGIVQWYEDCDDGANNGTSNSSCSIWCNLEDAWLAGCFNVGNANLSVQENELLPFWRTVDGDKNTTTTCDASKENKVQSNSLQCTFKIYNAQGIVDIIQTPCKNSNTSAIFSYFNSIGASSFTHAYGKFSTPLDSNLIDGIYGEYKISLDDVSYDYCNGTEFVSWAPLKTVCETNFTVTKPYLAQKSSFGLTPKATNISLEGYKMLNGWTDLIKSTDLADIMVLDESVYNGSNKVQAMINTFITKYDKIALTVPTASLKDTAFEWLGITVKVVPKQKIYILSSATKKTITLQNIKKFTTPFTIVTKNLDVVIKGNVDYNGMFLVKGGTITFEKSDEVVGGDRCPSTQVVKGIFVTDGGFLGGEKLANTVENKQRCTYGWLYVKGILIGNNVENIVESRRSQLNHWFKVGWTSDAAIRAERRNEIFNGAALLIEYSPSLWTSLPPGASEFTKALDIYKQ